MKKGIAPLFIILAVLVIGGLGVLTTKVFKNNNSSNNGSFNNQETSNLLDTNIFKDQTDLCVSINKDTVSSFLGKPIIKTETMTSNGLESCQYYLDETHALVLNHDYTSISGKLKGHQFLDREVTSNNSIFMKNYVIMQDDGLINEIYLVFNDSEFVSINRPNGKLISEDEIINFAKKLADFFQRGEPDVKKETTDTVPLPQEEDIVRNFFVLIDEKKIPEAISMMSDEMVGNDSMKQAWGIQFNDIKSINVLKIEPSMKEEWSASKHSYKVTLEAYVSSDAANAPIPYYGWEDNPNIRWVEIIKVGNFWKINSLATGP